MAGRGVPIRVCPRAWLPIRVCPRAWLPVRVCPRAWLPVRARGAARGRRTPRLRAETWVRVRFYVRVRDRPGRRRAPRRLPSARSLPVACFFLSFFFSGCFFRCTCEAPSPPAGPTPPHPHPRGRVALSPRPYPAIGSQRELGCFFGSRDRTSPTMASLLRARIGQATRRFATNAHSAPNQSALAHEVAEEHHAVGKAPHYGSAPLYSVSAHVFLAPDRGRPSPALSCVGGGTHL